MGKHSKIGASSMYRWSECPGSVGLCDVSAPSKSSIHAMEGSFAHEVAAYRLSKGLWPLPEVTDKFAEECGVEKYTIGELDAAVKAIKVYTEYVASIVDNEKVEMKVEHKFNMSHVYPDLFGTADCVIYTPKDKYLRVIDYKHGRGIRVEVEHNVQLMYYGLGVLETLHYPVEFVELTIVQPRCYHVKGPIRSWRMKAIDLIDFEQDLLYYAKRTGDTPSFFKAGEHCFFCAGIDLCPKRTEALEAKAGKKFTPSYKTSAKDDFAGVNI